MYVCMYIYVRAVNTKLSPLKFSIYRVNSPHARWDFALTLSFTFSSLTLFIFISIHLSHFHLFYLVILTFYIIPRERVFEMLYIAPYVNRESTLSLGENER